MIATITAIAEKKKEKVCDRNDDMETTIQRSQRQRSLRKKKFYLAIVIAAIAGEWFPYDRYDRCDC